MRLNVLQLWLQYKGDELTLLQKSCMVYYVLVCNEYQCLSLYIGIGCNTKDLFVMCAKFVLLCWKSLALVEKALRVGTCKYPYHIVNFHVRSVLAEMQKNWSLFSQNLCFLCIVLPLKLVSIFEFSPVLAAV